ncbi:MAG TPA: bifunctional glycosyltransferase/class I SAM-dependent methyltransferase [Bryobacteraceae bacterium]|nr:bifunctional glycosyltransferase/class I SAM-dependent methyltransferase [Bryobacteraceae bacterium]
MKSTTSLSVIVPAYNEQHLVATSLDRLRVLGESTLLERVKVIVVNDGSTDGTASSLEEFRHSLAETPARNIEWIFIRHTSNQGKAAAIHSGLEHADTELTVIHDADLEYHPQDLLKMTRVFLQEPADAVYGSRFLASEYRRVLFFRHEIGNRLLTLMSNIVSDLNLTDMETCYKMVRTDLLKSIPLVGKGFAIEPEITIKLAKRAARIFEVPIRYSGRTYQEGKKIGVKDGFRAMGAIIRFACSDHVYAGDEYGSQILGRLNRAPRFTQWMADVIRPYIGQRVLEIGAGTGNLTMQLIPRKLYYASDINPHYLTYLENLIPDHPYLRVGYTDGEKHDSYPLQEKFDTVICLNVVEHLENDSGALRNILDALEENGRAIVLVPCGPGLYGTLDKVLGHFRRYTKSQFTELAARAGFQLEELLTFNRFGSPAWWLNGRLLRRKTFGLWQIKMLNVLTPMVRVIDRFLPLPPLSIIAILRKPSVNAAPEPARSPRTEAALHEAAP